LLLFSKDNYRYKSRSKTTFSTVGLFVSNVKTTIASPLFTQLSLKQCCGCLWK